MGAPENVFNRLFRGKAEHAELNAAVTGSVGRNAVKTVSAARIMFGAIFLFDGLLKWLLFQQGNMQGVVQSYGIDSLSNNWVLVGVLVGLGETVGGTALILGRFQRPAAIWSTAIMGAIWALGGYGGLYGSGGFTLNGQTDPGGDLMLALVFLVLVFTPYAYGVASRLHLRDRWPGASLKARILRFLVT